MKSYINVHNVGYHDTRRKMVTLNMMLKKDVPTKVLWYFPIILRLKRLFTNANDAKLIRSHAYGHKKDGMLRFALATDGINPYDNLSNKHST